MIYFDNAATTPSLFGIKNDVFSNPSSPHGLGILAERELEKSRHLLRTLLGIKGNITFTSGGTESNNLAIIGFALANKRNNITIFAEPWEHPSILEPIKFAKEHIGCTAHIAPKEMWQTSSKGIQLVCISHVNHETGNINDVLAMAQTLKNENSQTIMLVDGAQGFCKEDFSPIFSQTDFKNIDMYSFSGHKCHAATGVGGLAIRDGVRITPLLYGGGQENRLRPGTENLDGILILSQTAKTLFESKASHHVHVTTIKAALSSITNELSNVVVNSRAGMVSPYILNMSFLGVKGETLVHLLSEKKIYASMGAACRSRKRIKSSLEIMGFDQAIATSAVRFSFSHLNTVEEAICAKKIIIESVKQLRRVLGYKR